jgi:hypothetical protein
VKYKITGFIIIERSLLPQLESMNYILMGSLGSDIEQEPNSPSGVFIAIEYKIVEIS